MSYMSFVAGGELSGGIKYAVGEMSGRGNVRHSACSYQSSIGTSCTNYVTVLYGLAMASLRCRTITVQSMLHCTKTMQHFDDLTFSHRLW